MFSKKTVLTLVFLAAVSTLPTDSAELQDRIVGGNLSLFGQFPHMVSLRSATTNNHFCGGVLISTRWVLSAAQCTIERTPENLLLLVGSPDVTGGIIYAVHQIINHEDYDAKTFTNDISLIQSIDKISGKYITPRPLSTEAVVGDGVSVIKSGWGETSVSEIN